MAGGRLGPTSRGVVLDEGRAEQLAGRRAALEAVGGLDEVARECGPAVGSAAVSRRNDRRRRVEAFLDPPERRAEEHGQAVVRARVGARDPQLQPGRPRWSSTTRSAQL